MVLLKRRTRMVSFRLSEHEYEDLKSLCLAEGARSISDFARAAICKLASRSTSSSDTSFESAIRRLSNIMEQLSGEVHGLSQFMPEDSHLDSGRGSAKAMPMTNGDGSEARKATNADR